MARRAGSFAPFYKGVIRDNGWPVWKCEHEHPTTEEARACSKKELGMMQVREYVTEQKLREMRRK